MTAAGRADRPGRVPGRRRTTVKVCGITRLEDARGALEAGADWLGFVIWPESPRGTDASRAGEILAALGDATGVCVMVAPHPDEAFATATRMGAQRVQLHRVNPAHWPTAFPLPLTFALTVAKDGSLSDELPAPEHLLMLDTAHDTLVGGTGKPHDWDVAAAVAARRDVLLAGGLDDTNVTGALERVRPFGVDASSRLESAPGIKDAAKVRRYVAAVRAWDALAGVGSP